MNDTLQDFSQRIRAAAADRVPLRFRGGGSKDWYGQTPAGQVLDTRGYRGIVDYDPTELVVTVRSGTPLTELEATLASQNQMLAFEPPHFGEHATVGGMVAAGLSGPRRQAVGAVRDFVLGTSIMDGRGQLLHFGGRVMKNVAGYDVSRVMAGSLGSLALLLDISLKVLPRPFVEETIRLEASQHDAVRMLNEWGGEPLPISASAWHAGQLMIRLSGANSAVRSARQVLGGEIVPDAENHWRQLREQTHAFFRGQPATPCWRLSVPSVTPPLGLPGEQLIEWGGALRWLRTEADAATVRAAVSAVRGHATLFHGGDKSVGVFQPLAPAVAAIHKRLKQAFDPEGIFNPGRLYQDF